MNYGVLARRSLLPRSHSGPAVVRTSQWSRNCIWGQASATTHPKAKQSTTSCDLFQVSNTQVGSWRGSGHKTAQEVQRARWTYLTLLQLKQHADQNLPNHFCVLEVMKANVEMSGRLKTNNSSLSGWWAFLKGDLPSKRQDVLWLTRRGLAKPSACLMSRQTVHKHHTIQV